MAKRRKREPCPVCQDTGVRSVTKIYHPITGRPTRTIKHPCRSCT